MKLYKIIIIDLRNTQWVYASQLAEYMIPSKMYQLSNLLMEFKAFTIFFLACSSKLLVFKYCTIDFYPLHQSFKSWEYLLLLLEFLKIRVIKFSDSNRWIYLKIKFSQSKISFDLQFLWFLFYLVFLDFLDAVVAVESSESDLTWTNESS